MYICICNGITDGQIQTAIENGASSVPAVYRAHGCQPQCGKCGCDIKDMLNQNAGSATPGGGAVMAPSKI